MKSPASASFEHRDQQDANHNDEHDVDTATSTDAATDAATDNTNHLTNSVDIVGILNSGAEHNDASLTSLGSLQINPPQFNPPQSNAVGVSISANTPIAPNANARHYKRPPTPPIPTRPTTIKPAPIIVKHRFSSPSSPPINPINPSPTHKIGVAKRSLSTTSITYYDKVVKTTESTESMEFPTIEVNILSNTSSMSYDSPTNIDQSNNNTSNTNYNNNHYNNNNNSNNNNSNNNSNIINNNNKNNKEIDNRSISPRPQRDTISNTTRSASTATRVDPVSPLTPKNKDKNQPSTNLVRRMSSSDRLMNMLDVMNKKQKPFSEQDYKDDDDNIGVNNSSSNEEEDYDDDNDDDASFELHVLRSTLSNDTHPASNQDQNHFDIRSNETNYYNPYNSTGGGMNVRSGRVTGNRDAASSIFSPASTISSSQKTRSYNVDYSTLPSLLQQHQQKPASQRSLLKQQKEDPTLHIQSFVLGIAFFAIWLPQNLMAPNLTQMAEYFHFSPEQRDLYLGANIALATGVLSLPLSALLGILADTVSSRIFLFAATVFCGGLSAICTGLSVTYTQLFFARFLCGGCMAGSVVIAFSILGDVFDAKDRNAASSGLTAMMGFGILLGQVFAGTVGDIYGWKVPFYISGAGSIVTSIFVLCIVKEPVRGGKEKVLQEMIASGKKYDRKLTMEGFIHAMTKNKTNVILMLQGLFTNVPWGIIFTFLNDYLSQEQGLSVPASTFLVFIFGIGSGFGSVSGGLVGGKCLTINQALLPLFMAASTILGIFPFLGLLDLPLNGPGLMPMCLALAGGLIANFPSVNVRPCILNVNPPESRGAAMTANNLMVNVARGAGPSLITLSQSFFGVSRKYSFNVTVSTDRIIILNKIVFFCT